MQPILSLRSYLSWAILKSMSDTHFSPMCYLVKIEFTACLRPGVLMTVRMRNTQEEAKAGDLSDGPLPPLVLQDRSTSGRVKSAGFSVLPSVLAASSCLCSSLRIFINFQAGFWSCTREVAVPMTLRHFFISASCV